MSDNTKQKMNGGYVLTENSEFKFIDKPRPYDLANYYWAKSDGDSWLIIRSGKVENRIECDLETIVETLMVVNAEIPARIDRT